MQQFDKWFSQKADEQEVIYSPEYWEAFTQYRSLHNRKRRMVIYWVSGIVSLLLISFIALLFYQSSEKEEATPKIATLQSLDHYDQVADELPSNGAVGSTAQEELSESSGPIKMDIEIPNPSQLEDIPAPTSKQSLPIGSEKSPADAFKNNDQLSEQFQSDIQLVSDWHVNSKISQPEVMEVLLLERKLPQNPLSAIGFGALLTLSDLQLHERTYNFYPGNIGRDPTPTTSLNLVGNAFFKPAASGDENLFTGGSIGLERQWIINRKWEINAALGMGTKSGNYGIQFDHPVITYDFQKQISGYQSLPENTFYSEGQFSIGRIQGPWTFFTAVSLYHLLGVWGDLINYRELTESNPDNPEFNYEVETSGWLDKAGFNSWPVAIHMGVNCRINDNWSIGLMPSYLVNGFINENHRSVYDAEMGGYIKGENGSWNEENYFQLAFQVKYHL